MTSPASQLRRLLAADQLIVAPSVDGGLAAALAYYARTVLA